MRASKSAKLLPRARTLYAEGLSKEEVAKALGVSPSTLYLWARQDEKAGLNWDSEREERRRSSPQVVLRILEKRFAGLVAQGEKGGEEADTKQASNCEERLLRLLKVIDLYRQMKGDAAVELSVLESFVRFCVKNLPGGSIGPIREAVQNYMEHLRSRNI